MADNSTCIKPIKGRLLRVSATDSCGVVITGSGSAIAVTKGFVKFDIKPKYEDGQEFKRRNADGDYCLNQQDAPALSLVDIDGEFCVFDPAAAALMTDQSVRPTSGTATGLDVFAGTTDAFFKVELWNRLGGTGRCASGTEQAFWTCFYFNSNTRVLDWAVEDAPFEFKLQWQALEPSNPLVPLWSWDLVAASGLPTEYCGTKAFGA